MEGQVFTVVLCNLGKDHLTVLVGDDVGHAELSPFFQQASHLLTRSSSREVEAEIVDCRFDADKTGKEGLARLNLSRCDVLASASSLIVLPLIVIINKGIIDAVIGDH